MKWHTREIPKGVYGELSKIREELEEAYDAQEQGQDLMLLIELSDIVGAVAGVAKKYGMTLEQLIKFSELRTAVAITELRDKVATEDIKATIALSGVKVEDDKVQKPYYGYNILCL